MTPCPIGDTVDQRLAASPSAVGPVSRPLPPQRPALSSSQVLAAPCEVAWIEDVRLVDYPAYRFLDEFGSWQRPDGRKLIKRVRNGHAHEDSRI